MRIGIDIDDTICFATETFHAYAMQFCYEHGKVIKLPLDATTWSVNDRFGWTEAEREEFFAQYYDKMLAEVKIKPLVRETLLKLKADGHEIQFITARYQTVKELTEAWMRRKNIYFDKLVVACEDKADGCLKNKIEVFLDDQPRHCLGVATAGIKTFLLDCAWNQAMRDKKITRVYSWPHFYEEVRKLAR